MTDKRWKALTVPYEVVASDDTEPQCYRLSGKTVRMLLAMIQYMEWRTRWHKGDGSELTLSEIDNVKSWAAQGAYELMTPEPCFDESCEEGDCVAYYPTNPAFSYAPNNPFVQCEIPPAGYLTCPLVAGVSSGIPGALPDDVYTTIPTLLPAPPLALIDQILNSGFPRVHMDFSGAGEIEVHLLEVAQGGLAIVRIDEVAYVNVVNLQGISLSDIALSLDFIVTVVTGVLDWKFIAEKIIEFNVPAGDHTLDILFIPNLSLNILETGWGGGLRSVVLCGDFTVTACPETLIDPIGGGTMPGLFDMCWFEDENGRVLRYTITGGCTWNDVGSCIDSPPTEPITPPDPIDEPGTFPDPQGDRCRIINASFYSAFSRSIVFFNTIINITPGDRAYALQQWLDSFDESGNGLQWFDPFNAFMQKYIPHVTAIESVIDAAFWEGLIDCIVADCYPLLTEINRATMECIADSLDDYADGLPDADTETLFRYHADWFRIYPLTVIRADAFRDSINSAVSDVCPSCGGGGGTCIPRQIGFEDVPVWLGIITGTIDPGFGRGATNALKAVNMGTINGAEGASYVHHFEVALNSVCQVDKVILHIRMQNSNPDSNANAVQNMPIRIRVYNGATLTGSKTYVYKPYYYTISAKYNSLTIELDAPATGDKVEIYTYFNTRYPFRTINYRMDDVTISVLDV